jgi:hypothetical protein
MNGDDFEILKQFARRLQSDPAFMAYALARYQKKKNLDESQLARRLGAPAEMIVRLAMCKSPDTSSQDFADHLRQLSDYTLIKESALKEVLHFGKDSSGDNGFLISLAKKIRAAFSHPTLIGGRSQIIFCALVAILLIAAGMTLRLWMRDGVGTEAEKRGSEPEMPPSTDSETPQPKKDETVTQTAGTKSRAMTIRIALDDRAILRGDADDERRAAIRLESRLSNLLCVLPEGNIKGAYRVRILDAFGKSVASATGRSPDGRTLSVLLDLRKLERKKYRLCISRSGEAPDCYPAIIEGE